jgi:hypothetical protein
LFIHIYRNPYKVYLSTKKMRHNVLRQLALQDTTEEDIEHHVVQDYIRLMQSFFEQKDKLSQDRFIEVRYEDLITDPMTEVQKIYARLRLPGLDQAEPRMNQYLARQAEYKTNVYAIDKKIIEYVAMNWKFTIDRWGYSPP